MAAAKPKKTEQIILRLDSKLDDSFRDAVSASGMGITEALRLAIIAMVQAQTKFGRIPKDMEIRQAYIGDVVDINELLERFQVLAETKREYLFQKKPPPLRRSHKNRGTGPDALVSDNPA